MCAGNPPALFKIALEAAVLLFIKAAAVNLVQRRANFFVGFLTFFDDCLQLGVRKVAERSSRVFNRLGTGLFYEYWFHSFISTRVFQNLSNSLRATCDRPKNIWRQIFSRNTLEHGTNCFGCLPSQLPDQQNSRTEVGDFPQPNPVAEEEADGYNPFPAYPRRHTRAVGGNY